jgi:hypothetical protein
MNSYLLRGMLILCTTLICGSASAAEFYDEARVVRSEPITRIDQHRRLAEDCLGGKPQTDNLIELLNWDLGTGHCEQIERTETITGYRVFYKWDNQMFSQVLPDAPGDTIPIRVDLN